MLTIIVGSIDLSSGVKTNLESSSISEVDWLLFLLLKYEFSNYELSFYFVNGKLSATCISDTNVWNK